MAVASFDLEAFRARYPEFATVADSTIEAYWDEASLYLNNTNCSRVSNIAMRGLLLNMLTAHLAALFSGVNGNPPSGIVGRVSSATEGSVSIAASMEGVTAASAWFMQTPYGAQFWQATAQYRQMVYRPGSSLPPRWRGNDYIRYWEGSRTA